jgi:hypothetical protein
MNCKVCSKTFTSTRELHKHINTTKKCLAVIKEKQRPDSPNKSECVDQFKIKVEVNVDEYKVLMDYRLMTQSNV